MQLNNQQITGIICTECGAKSDVEPGFQMSDLDGGVCKNCKGDATKVFIPIVKEKTNGK